MRTCPRLQGVSARAARFGPKEFSQLNVMAEQTDSVRNDRPSVLRDLATIYVALAMRDGRDDEDLAGEIAGLLAKWAWDGSIAAALPDVQSAIDVFRRELSASDLVACIQRVRDHSNPNDRRVALQDLISLALEDGAYSSLEARFVGALAREWDVHPEEPEHRLWSVFEADGLAGAWSRVHDLAIVYISLAHGSDRDLTQAEIDAIARKLGEWLPAALPSDVVVVLSEALRRYAEGPEADVVEASVTRIRESVPAHQRDAIISDLEYIAQADNVVLVEERAIIERLTRAWSDGGAPE